MSHCVVMTTTIHISKFFRTCLLLIAASATTSLPLAIAQKPPKTKAPTTVGPLVTQTITRHESQRLGFGGTVTVVGAPVGSVTIEGWQRSEVDVTADIELNAPTEEDLKRIAAVDTFMFDQDLNHIRIVSMGTHDKTLMKKIGKDFPKALLGMPWKIDFRIHVPVDTDLEINTGRGPIKISGVEGALRLSASESETDLMLTGGTVAATIGVGKVNLDIPVRSWRGGGADIRLASGTLTVNLMPGFNGDIDADILRTGAIEDKFGGLESREKPGITSTQVKARAGAGGAFFNFTVGDGMVYLKKTTNDQ